MKTSMWRVFISVVLTSAILVNSIRLDCDHNYREYQVALKSEIFSEKNSFIDGVATVLDELVGIERARITDFKVSGAILAFKNITKVDYEVLLYKDLRFELTLESLKTKIDKPAEFFIKIPNPHPILACIPLHIADNYVNTTEVNFELNIHATSGQLLSMTTTSYKITPDIDNFIESKYVNITSILTNARFFLTHSGYDVIAIPKQVTMQSIVEFDVQLGGKIYQANIIMLQDHNTPKHTLSIRIKGVEIHEDSVMVAEQFIKHISLVSSIAELTTIPISDASKLFFSPLIILFFEFILLIELKTLHK